MPTIGIITGLASEARTLGRQRRAGGGPAANSLHVRASGGNAAAIGEAVADFQRHGVGLVVSYGIAGALDPALSPGDLLLPEKVSAPDGSHFTTDRDAREWLRDALGPRASRRLYARAGLTVAGHATPVTSPRDKEDLYQRQGAAIVDMESHHVAAACRGRGLSFIVVRTVADPAWRALPSGMETLLTADGKVRPAAALKMIAGKPALLVSFMGLARDTTRAYATLRGVGPLIGGIPNL